jgi:hypothetical protein
MELSTPRFAFAGDGLTSRTDWRGITGRAMMMARNR